MSEHASHLSAAAETVLTFLENAGKRSEAEFYLRLFRQLPKQSFALVLVGEPALSSAPATVVEQLRFLSDLGLHVSVVLGVWSPHGSNEALLDLAASLSRRGLSPAPFQLSEPALSGSLTQALQSQHTPLVLADIDSPFESIGKLARELGTRKVVVVRRHGGLGPHGMSRVDLAPGHSLPAHAGGISLVNLRSDQTALEASNKLSPADRELLRAAATILEHAKSPRSTLSVTSPLALLNELFTVKGAGTLIKLGSSIGCYADYDALDRERLTALLESSFGRKLASRFFECAPLGIYLEENYRGAAILQPGKDGAFLTKFAVDPIAQGEGIGQDLWRAMLRNVEKLYWRARPENAIMSWYKSVCDGFTHHGDWSIFWRGYAPRQLPDLIEDALARPQDFEG